MQAASEIKSTKRFLGETFSRLFVFTVLFIFLLGTCITWYQLSSINKVYEDRLRRSIDQYKDELLNDLALGDVNFVMQDLNAMQNELNIDAIHLYYEGKILHSQQNNHFSTVVRFASEFLNTINYMRPVVVPLSSDFGNINAVIEIHYVKSITSWTVLPAILSSIALFLISIFPVGIIFFLLFRRINQSLLTPLRVFTRHLNLAEPLAIAANEYHEQLLEMKELRLASERFADEKIKTASALSLSLIAAQVAHDIKSPVAAILMLSKSCSNLPEKERISFREAGHRIQEIANNLIVQYRGEKSPERDVIKPCLLSAMLLSIISEKNIQYKNLSLQIFADISSNGSLVFVRVNPAQFKRMISNLINNAVEAAQEQGSIKIAVEATQNEVIITIADNGVGMSAEVVENILARTHYSHGKDKGLGLGIPHAIDTVRDYGGHLSISSEINNGTLIVIKLPQCPAPSWISKELSIRPGDCVVILDDDKSIHQAWDTKFKSFLAKGEIQITHFTNPQACKHFLETSVDREKLLLLVDYELIGYDINGLDIIEHCQIERAILVTSHYENEEIIKRCQLLNVQLLPKMLCSDVKVQLTTATDIQIDFMQANAILVDDNKQYTDTVAIMDEKIITFNDASSVIQILHKVQKHMRFYLDYDLGDGLNGRELAEILYHRGYRELYMISGYPISDLAVPYVKGYVDKSQIVQ